MARFYFHLLNGDGLTRDSEGVDLPDLSAAQDHARKALAEIIAEDLARCRDTVRVTIMIEDHEGSPLADLKSVTSVGVEQYRASRSKAAQR